MGLSHPQCQETSLAHWTTATLKFKDKSLKYDKGNFIAVLKLSADTLHEISWWKNNIYKVFKYIKSTVGSWIWD